MVCIYSFRPREVNNTLIMKCAVCLECDDKQWLALVCGHVFCIDCIIMTIRKRYRKCPLCRTYITWTIPAIEKYIKEK